MFTPKANQYGKSRSKDGYTVDLYYKNISVPEFKINRNDSTYVPQYVVVVLVKCARVKHEVSRLILCERSPSDAQNFL